MKFVSENQRKAVMAAVKMGARRALPAMLASAAGVGTYHYARNNLWRIASPDFAKDPANATTLSRKNMKKIHQAAIALYPQTRGLERRFGFAPEIGAGALAAGIARRFTR